MAMRIHSATSGAWAACLAAGLAAVPTTASAGERHRPLVYMTPVAPVVPYAAPAPIYSAPAYAAPAYSAPYMMSSTYSAPAVYSAPAAVVGNAPAANGAVSRIKAVDRADLIEDARHDMKSDSSEGKLSERRKSLREKVRGLYAAAVDDEETALNAAEEQDVEAIVASLLDPNGAGLTPVASLAPVAGQAPAVYQQAPAVYQQAPAVYQQAPAVYQQAPAVGYAPVVYQQAPSMYIQPMTPVQFLVPVQSKHGLFRR
ncbi:MAG: hypothetical protein BGO49_20925 [Planctomycetales bacterium 71-10]|nr:MAG: hypothetical protein BGO49_20925 [Planctomycetales bacterium 71-10]